MLRKGSDYSQTQTFSTIQAASTAKKRMTWKTAAPGPAGREGVWGVPGDWDRLNGRLQVYTRPPSAGDSLFPALCLHPYAPPATQDRTGSCRPSSRGCVCVDSYRGDTLSHPVVV